MSDKAEQYGQGILPGLEAVRLPQNLVRFAELIAIGHHPETGKKLNQTEAAEMAGIGNSRDSARKLASHYMKDERVKALIERLRLNRWDTLQLQQLEVVASYRDLVAMCMASKKVKSTVVTEDGDTHEVESYQFKPGEAERALKVMAEITGLIGGDKNNGPATGTGSTPNDDGQGRELSDTERSARVFDLLKRSGVVGTGSTATGTDGNMGATAGATN